jgi:hypothetical protein
MFGQKEQFRRPMLLIDWYEWLLLIVIVVVAQQ